jgi:hypothetical protein
MSENGFNTMPKFELTVKGQEYNLNILVEALSFAHDYAAAEDIRNAAKNIAEPKLSPLTLAIERALELLQELRERAANIVEGNTVEDPAEAIAA